MTVRVTGGTDFIGRHLVDVVSKDGTPVKVLTRETNLEALQHLWPMDSVPSIARELGHQPKHTLRESL